MNSIHQNQLFDTSSVSTSQESRLCTHRGLVLKSTQAEVVGLVGWPTWTRRPESRVPSHAVITVFLMDERKLLMRLARGAVTNVAFADLCSLAEGLGFELRRVSGSHHVFAHPDIPQLINLQSLRGQAKPYQVRQLLRLVERYDLRLKDRP
jgi:HicA toxin of bacterial toxin-antitoxin,